MYPIDTPSPAPSRRLVLLAGGGVGLSAFLFTCAILAFILGMVALPFLLMRNSAVTQLALARAQEDRELQEQIGTPIKLGWFVGGSIETGSQSGSADLSIPVSGPRGAATLYVTAIRRAGTWRIVDYQAKVKTPLQLPPALQRWWPVALALLVTLGAVALIVVWLIWRSVRRPGASDRLQ